MPDANPDLTTMFSQALERTDLAGRADDLDHVCGEDIALRERVEALFAAHDGAGRPLRATGRLSPGTHTILGGPLFMAIAIVGGAMGLTRFAFHVSRQAEKLEGAENVEAHRIVRSEVLRVWLPRTLTELAQRPSQSHSIATHDELRRSLEHQHQQGVWYALTLRAYQDNAVFSDITVVRRPYDDGLFFSELLAVLATAAGNPPAHPISDFSKASVELIPEDLLNRDPIAAMGQLLGHPNPAADQERSP